MLTIKASGHDYKGRSGAPGSLSLWVRSFFYFCRRRFGHMHFIPTDYRPGISLMYVKLLPAEFTKSEQLQMTFSRNFVPEGGDAGQPAITLGVSQAKYTSAPSLTYRFRLVLPLKTSTDSPTLITSLLLVGTIERLPLAEDG